MNQIHPQVLKYTNIRTCYTSFLFLPDKWTNAFYKEHTSTHQRILLAQTRANSRKLALLLAHHAQMHRVTSGTDIFTHLRNLSLSNVFSCAGINWVSERAAGIVQSSQRRAKLTLLVLTWLYHGWRDVEVPQSEDNQ